VAALTMPALMANYQKQVKITKLKKFYSVMTQAIKRSSVDNGDPEDWIPAAANANFPDWYEQYLSPYIQTQQTTAVSSSVINYIQTAFNDGSGFAAYRTVSGTHTWFFYCLEYKNCKPESYNGKDTFLFAICNDGRFRTGVCTDYISRAGALSGCKNSDPYERHFCTRLIELDDWQIRDDYPW
jgi:hypothetical protein